MIFPLFTDRVLSGHQAHLWGMKREPIRTPFLAKAKESDYQESLALFKLILRFMNDNNLSDTREKALGDYIVNKVTGQRRFWCDGLDSIRWPQIVFVFFRHRAEGFFGFKL